MRAVLVTAALCAATLQLVGAQERMPRGYLYRGPLYWSRAATAVEPQGGLPLEFANSAFSFGFDSVLLRTMVRSKTVRSIAVSGIRLRMAFGPTAHGMITFRLRPAAAFDPVPEPPSHITPDRAWRRLVFALAPEDPRPAFLSLTPDMKIVFTVERIEGENGIPIFDNPDATELLWVALGRPAPPSEP